LTSTSSPITSNSCEPKSATPTLSGVAAPVSVSHAGTPPSKMYICMRGLAPSLGVDMSELLRPE